MNNYNSYGIDWCVGDLVESRTDAVTLGIIVNVSWERVPGKKLSVKKIIVMWNHIEVLYSEESNYSLRNFKKIFA